MSDVSTWHPLDSDNNAPPPDGWPEFMQPSMVNNSARAMMGAVRRMYDQMVAGSLALPYLKLSGGTVAGAVTVSGAFTASTITSNSTIYSASTISTGGAISAAGNISGGSVSTGNISATGSISVGGNVDALTARVNSHWIDIDSQLFADRRLGGHTQICGSDGTKRLVLATNSANYHYADAHAFYNKADSQIRATIDGSGLTVSTGSINVAAGNLDANYITARNNLAASGNLSVSGSSSVGGWNYANGIQYGNEAGWFRAYAGGKFDNVESLGNITAGGNVNITGGSINISGSGGAGGGDLTVAMVLYAHDVMPSANNVSICGGAAAAWNTVMSYNFVTASDVALKQDIGPLPDTLPLVAALAPKAFQYEGDDDRRHWGFVAQDVRAAIGSYPVDIVSGEEGRLGLDYGGLTAMLWKAVQELTARLTALENAGGGDV